jgi:hypothetical protein
MSNLRHNIAAQLWWWPRDDKPLLGVCVLILGLTASFMLWLQVAPGLMGLMLWLLGSGLLVFLSVGRIPEIAHSEAFALLPARTSQLRGALLGLLGIVVLGCVIFGLYGQHWLRAGMLGVALSVMLIAFSAVFHPRSQIESLGAWLIVVCLCALPVVGIAWAAKHHHQLPEMTQRLLIALPVIYALGLLGWRMWVLARWQAPRPSASGKYLLPISVNMQTFMILSHLFLCATVMNRNPFADYYLVSVLPLLCLSSAQPGLLRDVMSRHWLGGMPREQLWQPALKLAVQSSGVNLLLLLGGLELCKWLPRAHAENLALAQFAVLTGFVPLLLWQLVQLCLTARARDAYWFGFNQGELPGLGPMRTTRSLRRLQASKGRSYFGATLCMFAWAASSIAMLWFWHSEPAHYMAGLLTCSAVLSLLAIPLLRSSLRRIEL